jgi:DNA-binding SARP family transcriptional activator
LAVLLWPNASEANARDSLRHALWRLRKAIQVAQPAEHAYLQADEASIALNAASNCWIDAAVLEHQNAAELSPDELIRVVSVYRGELLPGVYDEWVGLERERLHAIFERKTQQLARHRGCPQVQVLQPGRSQAAPALHRREKAAR